MGEAKLDATSTKVRDQLAEALAALDTAADHLSGFSAEAKDERPALHRGDSAVALGRALIGLNDPTTTPIPVAEAVQENAASLRDQLQQAAGSDGGGNIGSPAEALLAELGRLRQPNGMTERAAKEAALRFRQSLDPRLRGMQNEVTRIEKDLDEAGESAGAQSKELNERLDALKEEIDTTQTRLQELLSDQETRFGEAQEERRKEFGSSLKEAEGQLSETVESLEKRRLEAAERLKEIEADIAETAAALGGRATALGHGAESIQQEKLAHWWSIGTIALLLLAAIVPIALGVLRAAQSPESVSGKIAIAAIIAGVAGYAAGISRHHRERAAAARRLELEMTSFDPFIAPLDRSDREDLRSTIVWRFFGGANEAQDPDSPPRPGKDLREILHLRRAKRDERPNPPES